MSATPTNINGNFKPSYQYSGLPPELAGRPLTASRFSINHEQGACPHCKGLGRLTECDPQKLVTDSARPLDGGALDGTKTGRFYGEPHGQYVAALRTAGRAMGIDFSVPYDALDEEARHVAMFGTGGRSYEVVSTYKRKRRAGEFRFKGPWKSFANLVTEECERKHADDRGEAMLSLMMDVACPVCGGARLKESSLAVRYAGLNIAELSALTVREASGFFEDDDRFRGAGEKAAAVTAAVRTEILRRLSLLRDAGLDYLAMDRRSATLPGGESGRLRLASQLGARLSGVTYVLDEPTIGLHPRDTARLVAMLKDMAGRGNTVVVVEHDIDVIRAADRLIDMGPGAGGGRVVAEGSPDEVAKNPALPTARYLAGGLPAPSPLPGTPRPGVRITGASANNLRMIDVDIPSGVLTAVTGVSGSGKSSLIFDVLTASARAGRPVGCRDIEGLERFERVVPVDQEPLNGGPRSIPATYAGMFDEIRSLFAATSGAGARGFGRSHFSFLTKEGRCETCRGAGKTTISMDFLADVESTCVACGGTRYNPEVLSGGEAQRLKLATGLARPAKGESLYVFDEPTTGLHFIDIEKLLTVFARLLGAGHTIVVVEHNLDVVTRAHHMIDLGPEGGSGGGRVVAAGTPPEIAASPRSYTGAALRRSTAVPSL